MLRHWCRCCCHRSGRSLSEDLQKPLGLLGLFFIAVYFIGLTWTLVILITGLVATIVFLVRREVRARRAILAEDEQARQQLTVINVHPGAVYLASGEPAPGIVRQLLARYLAEHQAVAPRQPEVLPMRYHDER